MKHENMKSNQPQRSLKVKTKIKAGGILFNHNQTQRNLKVKTKIKAGGVLFNHNQTLMRAV